MARVVQRLRTTVRDDVFVHHERKLSWSRADAIAGRRLDRRKNYTVINGQVCSAVNWTERCSGCSNGREDRGGGCLECGYHGVVRNSVWMPDDGAEPL